MNFYDFSVSTYNADLEKFEITIQDGSKSTTKNLYISIDKAPRFKSNINQHMIYKALRPTADGEWKESEYFIQDVDGTQIPWGTYEP